MSEKLVVSLDGDVLYTVSDVAKRLKSNPNYVHKLRKAGLLSFMKLGNFKTRKTTFEEFLEKYDGYDLTDPFNPKLLEGGDA